MCHKFNSQNLGLRDMGLRMADPKSQGLSSRFLGHGVLNPRVPDPGWLVPGPESEVAGLGLRLCHLKMWTKLKE